VFGVVGRNVEATDLDLALFEQTLRVNVVGYALGAKYAFPQVISQVAASSSTRTPPTGSWPNSLHPTRPA
jgi:hypothetical protein